MKRMFSAKKVQMLTLMLLCGTTAVMAQNSAGDYSAGTTALATVTEEIAKYVPVIVKTCSDSLFSIGQKNCQLFVAKLRNFLDSHNRMVLY